MTAPDDWAAADHEELARRLGSERAAAEEAAVARLAELVGVVFRLRDADGCPWDREQTLDSMAANLVEEACEAGEAVAAGDDAHVAEELGDTLMNILLMARIAEQEGRFDLSRVASRIAVKLVRRHPHVFGDVDAADAEAALRSWEESKRAERDGRAGDEARPAGPDRDSRLDGVPASLPALLAALRVGQKAAGARFDWPDAGGALDKLREEVGELQRAAAGDDADAVAEELGDVLFSAVNVARKHGLDPELALRRTIGKFRRRFEAIEAALGAGLEAAPLEELERHWRAAARAEATDPSAGETAQG